MNYELHGLTLDSELELDAHPAAGGAPVDYAVRAGEPRPIVGRPAGRLLSEAELGEILYWLVEPEDEAGPDLLLRIVGLADYEVRGAEITVSEDPAAPRGYAPILLTGTVLSRLLGIAGRLVLHAAAVEVDGSAIALLADSGGGKSTTAAHLCLAGAKLATDDTLAVEFGEPAEPVALRGTPTIRLRQSAKERLAGVEGWLGGATADERVALRPPSTQLRRIPLGAVAVIERPTGQAALEVVRLSGIEAAARLLRYPRSIGWSQPEHLTRQFELSARLADRVPVLVVRPAESETLPDHGELGAELLDGIASGAAAR